MSGLEHYRCDICYSPCRIQGFPTIKAYVNGRMIDYNGDRSAGHLKDWAISLIPQKVSLPAFVKLLLAAASLLSLSPLQSQLHQTVSESSRIPQRADTCLSQCQGGKSKVVNRAMLCVA